MSSSSTASKQTAGKGGVRVAAVVTAAAAALGLATGLLVGAHFVKRNACRGRARSTEVTPLHKGRGGATTITAAGDSDGVDGAKKVAVVTGGSRGIGAAISRKLGEAGYTVAVVYQSNSKAADSVVASIVANGGQAAAFQCNVAVEADIMRLFAEVKDRLGPVSALVNNAGVIGNRSGSLDNQGMDDMLPVFAVNTFGPFVCCREAARQMSTKHGGTGGAIVNISSGSALLGMPMIYAMSKGALNSMSTAIKDELIGQGIRLNSISPGLTATDMVSAEMAEKIVPGIPMKRMGQPEEIAAVAVWLLSQDASYVCGAHIRVAGGRMMGGLQ